MTKGRKFTIVSIAALIILCTAVVLLGVALTAAGNTYTNGEVKLSSVADTTAHTIQGYSYGFGEYKKIDGLTFTINETSGLFILKEWSQEKLNTTYGESKWRFVDASNNQISYGFMGSGQSAYLRFDSLPDKFIYLRTDQKAVELYVNDWGIYKDLNTTGLIYISQTDFNNSYRCNTPVNELDSEYGANSWRFINERGEDIQYTNIQGFPFFKEYPAGFCFDKDLEYEELSYINFSKLYTYGATDFLSVNYEIPRKGDYVILPRDFYMFRLQGTGELIKENIEFNYLDYTVVKYDDFSKYTLAYDPTDVTYALMLRADSNLTISLNYSLLSIATETFIFENHGITKLADGTYKCGFKLYDEFIFMGIVDNTHIDIIINSEEFKDDYIFNTKPIFISVLEQEKYNINYELNGGTWYITQPPKEVTNWFTHTLPNPSRNGYVFDGFYDNPEFTGNVYTEVGGIVDNENPTVLNGDITLYAKWSQVTNEVRYNLDGGTCENLEDYTSYISGTNMELPTPTKRGCNFLGWYDKNNIKIDSLKADVYYGDVIILTAKWDEIRYNIDYKQNGGTFYITQPPKTFGVNGIEKLPSSSRQGYIFAGWYLDEQLTNRLENDCIPADFVIDHDITVYAKWTPAMNEVRYNLDGGVCDNLDDYTSYLSGTDMELPTPIKEGYNFLGWYDKNNIKIDSLKADVYYGDVIILTAKWEMQTFTVTYHFGTNIYRKTYNYGEEFSDLSFVGAKVTGEQGFISYYLIRYKFLGFSTKEITVDGWKSLSETSIVPEIVQGPVKSDLEVYAYCYQVSKTKKFGFDLGNGTLYFRNCEFSSEELEFTLLGGKYNLENIGDEDVDDVFSNDAENSKTELDEFFDNTGEFFKDLGNKTTDFYNQNKWQVWLIIAIVVIIIVGAIVLKILF